MTSRLTRTAMIVAAAAALVGFGKAAACASLPKSSVALPKNNVMVMPKAGIVASGGGNFKPR